MQQRYFHALGNGAFHRIAYTDWGNATNPHVVVCVHGLARNSRDFDYLADALTPECHVVCMDVAGRGESDWLERKSEYKFSTYQNDAAAMLARASAPAGSRWLDRFSARGEPRVDWVGTSMGGLIGMLLAAKKNSPIRRLVLNDVGPLIPWSALFRMKGYMTRGRRFASEAEVETYLRDVCAPFGPLSDEQWHHLARHGARRGAGAHYELRYDPGIGEGLHGHIDHEFPLGPDLMRGIDLWSIWGKVQCPTLVLRGAQSEVLLPATLAEMRAQARSASGGVSGRGARSRADERGADPGGKGFPAAVKALAALLVASAVHAAEPLPALHAAREGVTVSGVSSGAYMAVQLHVAHSARVAGVGAIAGGPYYCAQGSLFTALYNCMKPGTWTPVPPVALLKARTELVAGANHIDATGNLARSRAWLFTGRADETVYPAVVNALREFYASYQTQVALVANQPAGHGMVTERAGNACGATAAPYIVHCDYDAAGELLRFLLGPLAAPAGKESGRLLPFDQRRYAGNDAHGIAMDDTGFVYVPERCAKERCRIHVAFHGCRQGAAEIGERFVREAGYNRWADANALVILYPQAITRYSPFIFNPRGCWDWWGYSSAAYHTREAPQIRAVMAMIERLGE